MHLATNRSFFYKYLYFFIIVGFPATARTFCVLFFLKTWNNVLNRFLGGDVSQPLHAPSSNVCCTVYLIPWCLFISLKLCSIHICHVTFFQNNLSKEFTDQSFKGEIGALSELPWHCCHSWDSFISRTKLADGTLFENNSCHFISAHSIQ